MPVCLPEVLLTDPLSTKGVVVRGTERHKVLVLTTRRQPAPAHLVLGTAAASARPGFPAPWASPKLQDLVWLLRRHEPTRAQLKYRNRASWLHPACSRDPVPLSCGHSARRAAGTQPWLSLPRGWGT